MSKNYHWNKEDYFPYLIQNLKTAVLALEYLVDDLHANKDLTIDKFLCHCGSEDFLWGIVKLMSSENLRVSGNSAYVFGTIAETDYGIERIISLLRNKSHPDSGKILFNLVNLLKSTDYECLMNAAGTIGTISESNMGREWLIEQPLLEMVIELSTNLLDNQNIWVSSNAALVIARISIEDSGCEKLLEHSLSEKILVKLINSLGCDNAGRGMNCAFAIGRICDSEERRSAVLKLANVPKLVESLSVMIEQNLDNGCTKNACFALTCIAGSAEMHQIIVDHPCFVNLLNVLCNLLITIKDPETQWFAAMLLRIFSGFPSGCLKMRSISFIWQTLNDLLNCEDLLSDVRDEITVILETLKPLGKPEPIKVEGPTQVFCEWEEVSLKNKLKVKYLLYKDNECVYSGSEKSVLVSNLSPYTQYAFWHQISTLENHEKSPMSDLVLAVTEESTPTEPLNLKSTGATTTVVKIAWDPPEQMNGQPRGYFVYKDAVLIEQTNELSCLLSGLLPGTGYDVHVCASTSKGKGDKANVKVSTCNLGDVIPERPTFGMIGRREILVRWQPPQVITGKLNRYELFMNGKCIYSGIAQEFQVGMLKPDTEYKFEIVAITTEGKCRSKLAKTRTLKDEYDPDRLPLYPGNGQLGITKEKADLTPEKRLSSTNTQNRPTILARQKNKVKIKKDRIPIVVSEEAGYMLNNNNRKLDNNEETNFSSGSFLPPVNLNNQTLSEHSRNNFLDESSYSNNQHSLYRPFYRSVDQLNASQTIQSAQPILQRGKTLIDRGSKSDNSSSNSIVSLNTSKNLNRSKTFYGINSRKNSQNQSSSNVYTHPTTITLELKDMTTNFPILPVVTNSSSSSSASSVPLNPSSNSYTNFKYTNTNQLNCLKILYSLTSTSSSSASLTTINSILMSKRNYFNPLQEATRQPLESKLTQPELSLQSLKYQYSMRNLNKENSIYANENIAPQSTVKAGNLHQ